MAGCIFLGEEGDEREGGNKASKGRNKRMSRHIQQTWYQNLDAADVLHCSLASNWDIDCLEHTRHLEIDLVGSQTCLPQASCVPGCAGRFDLARRRSSRRPRGFILIESAMTFVIPRRQFGASKSRVVASSASALRDSEKSL